MRIACAATLFSFAAIWLGCYGPPTCQDLRNCPTSKPDATDADTLSEPDSAGRIVDVGGADGSAGDDLEDIWAVGELFTPSGGVIIHRTRNASWQIEFNLAPGPSLHDVWGTSASDVWAVGEAILHYDGSQWVRVPSPGAQTLKAVWGSSRTDVWACGFNRDTNNGSLLHYDGNSWQLHDQSSLFVDVTCSGIWGTGPRDVWLVGNSEKTGAKLLHFDAFANWSDKTPIPGLSAYFTGIWVSSSTSGWVVGSDGLFLQLGGTQWGAINPPPTTANLLAISGASSNEVWAVGMLTSGINTLKTQVLRFGGSSWASVPLGVAEQDATILDIFVRSASDIWMVGGVGVILHHDGLKIAAYPNVPTQADLWGVWGTR